MKKFIKDWFRNTLADRFDNRPVRRKISKPAIVAGFFVNKNHTVPGSLIVMDLYLDFILDPGL